MALKKLIKKHITPELIEAVLEGAYGEGKERNAKLKEDGYAPSAVTKKINDLKKLAEELAPMKTKAGDYFRCVLHLMTEE